MTGLIYPKNLIRGQMMGSKLNGPHLHHRGGRVIKSCGRVASVAPCAVALMFVTSQATADTTISTAETTQQTITVDENVTVTSAGSIETNGPTNASLYINKAITAGKTISNAGTISNQATGFSSAVLAYQAFAGTFSNTGRISNTLSSASSQSTAVYFNDSQAGSYYNSGSISVSATQGGDLPRVYGFYIAGSTSGFLNDTDGTITAAHTGIAGQSQDPTVGGVHVTLASTGGFENRGMIGAQSSQALGSAAIVESNVFAVYYSQSLSGGFRNSGTIQATGSGSSDTAKNGTVYSYGVRLSGGVSDGIINSGEIKAYSYGGHNTDNTGDTTSYAFGLENFGATTGGINLTSSSAFTIEAVGGDNSLRDGFVEAAAMTYFSTVTGGVNLDGTISVSGTGGSNIVGHGSVKSKGAAFYGVVDGDITDNSTLTVTALEKSSSGVSNTEAVGILVDRAFTDTFTHTGKAVISATSADSDADAYGLRFRLGMNGTLNLKGDISATASTSASGKTASAYAVHLGPGAGTLNIENTAELTGLIYVDEHDVNFDAVSGGGSFTYSFEDNDTANGAFVTNANGLGVWSVTGAGGAAPVYSFVASDPITSVPIQTGSIGSVANGMSGQLFEFSTGSSEDIVSRGSSEASQKWFGGSNYDRITTVNATSGNTQATHTSGLSAGKVFGLQSGDVFGLVAGGLSTSSSTYNAGTQTFNQAARGFFAGFSGGKNYQNTTVSFGLAGGALENTSKRFVTGTVAETATGSYRSTWLGANIGVRSTLPLAGGVSLIPSAELRGTVQYNPGYTETGATANASYSKSTSSVVEADIGLKAQTALGTGLLSASVGWVTRNATGNNAVDITVAGTTSSVSASVEDYSSARIGLGYDFSAAGGEVSLAADALVGSDGVSGQSISAVFNISF